jgi:hypothetical protein
MRFGDNGILAFAGAIIAMLLNWWYFKVTGRDSLTDIS